ncbi:hypothetical protein B0H13DRAFT_2357130 [Mycena leptocephala]|nr:hypothetical protein B0H13DRAFT_2357130 [Mycena leptocephala]
MADPQITALLDQVASLNDRVNLLEADVAELRLHLELVLPLSTIVKSILVKVGASHLMWATVEGRWLTVEEVRLREYELDWEKESSPNDRIETLSARVAKGLKDGLAHGLAQQEKSAERLAWEKRRVNNTITKRSPTVSALPRDARLYPKGRGDKPPIVAFIKKEYVSILQVVNQKAHRYTARIIADALSILHKQPDQHPGLATYRALYLIIFGFPYTRVPVDKNDLEVENYGSDDEGTARSSKRSSRGYFEHEQDVGNHEFLAECAEKAGVFSAEEACTFLAGTELKDNVGKDIMQVVSVSGVPFVIVDNKYVVSGAQGTVTFIEIFRRLAAGNKLVVESEEGEMC